jgi:hypothetical protein
VLGRNSYAAWLAAFLISGFAVLSQTDTAAQKVKLPKHYFATTLYADVYSIGRSNFISKQMTDGEKELAKKLGSYQYSQSLGGFYFPFKTREKTHDDGRVSNWHWLGTGNYLLAMPRFAGIGNHNLVKVSLGVRGIYNSGRKNIWFIDLSPFVSGDLGRAGTFAARWGSTVLYDRIINPKFSFRVGYTRTFILGNRFHLPYLGFRVGRLDRIYFSMQFPRGMTFSVPMRSKARFSVFTRPTGGLFTMGNSDSLYNGLTNSGRLDSTIIFGRYDGLFGFRFDFRPNRHVSFFFEFGKSNVRALAFFSREYNTSSGTPVKDNVQVYKAFFTGPLQGGGFVSLGLSVRIGKTRSVYNNYNMYEVFHANSSIAPGDNNNELGPGQIPNAGKAGKGREATNLSTTDVQDLIETQDLYN